MGLERHPDEGSLCCVLPGTFISYLKSYRAGGGGGGGAAKYPR